MIRLIHLVVIAALVVAAAWVYRIKFEATVQAERVAKLQREVRHERDAIAILRAEWARLDSPARIQGLAERHLALKPIQPHQFDRFDNLPAMPSRLVPPNSTDPIGAAIDALTAQQDMPDQPTGSIRDASPGR